MALKHQSSFSEKFRSLPVRKTLTDEIAREAIISSLAYSNLAVFVAVLFCFAGLNPHAAIYYVACSFCVFVLTAIVGGLYQRMSHSNPLMVGVIFCVIANELALSAILIFDYFGQERASTLSGIVILVSISFISVHLCARFTRPMIVSKCVTIFACCLFIIINPMVSIPKTESIASLIVALLIMLATGYWIVLRRRDEVVLQLQLKDLNHLLDNQNRKLTVALDEKEIAQKQLEQEHNLRQKLVSHIGHDLRQPISAASYMLIELGRNETSDVKRTIISDTNECMSSASRMIEDIVQFTHFDNLEIEVIPEWVDVNRLLNLVSREFLSLAENADCKICCVRTTASVFVDPDLLKRVIRNLTVNVIKHSDATRLLLGVRRRASGLEIWVADNGKGLSNEASGIAKVDVRSSQAGLGLGIKIAEQLSVACGAQLSHCSQPGEGTVFKLDIPTSLVRWPASLTKPDLH